MTISILLTATPLNPPAILAAITHPDAGGIAVFLGTTRAETDPERGELMHLEYHAYPEMAEKEMRKLADSAGARWSILAIAVHHRLGIVGIGEPSVVIAVATPHRAEAFEACRYVIDELKKSVPIWKREHYTGAARWQAEGEGHSG